MSSEAEILDLRGGRHVERILALAMVGVFLCLQVSYMWGIWVTSVDGGVDFAQYYVNAEVLRQDLPIYTMKSAEWDIQWNKYVDSRTGQPGYLPYPPLLASLIIPLTRIRWRAALLVWNTLSILALLASAIALSRLVAGRWVDPVVFGTAALWGPTYSTLHCGQINNFILLSVVLFLLLMQRYRTYAAALALSAGLALKPLAAPLLVYLSWRRDYRKLLAVVSGLAVMAGITAALAGPRVLLQFFEVQFFENAPGVRGNFSPWGPPKCYPPNQSFFGFFGRALTANPYGPSIANDPEAARLLSFLAIGAVLSTIALLTWPRKGPDTFAQQVGLVLVAIPLVEPFGEYHHATLVMVPFLLSFYAAESVAGKTALATGLALLDAQPLLWHQSASTFLLSLGTYGMVIIFCVSALLLHRQRRTVMARSGASEPGHAPSKHLWPVQPTTAP